MLIQSSGMNRRSELDFLKLKLRFSPGQYSREFHCLAGLTKKDDMENEHDGA